MEAKKYDLVVAGGGLSGVAAALSAAREGLNVLIFDKSNCFGGAAVGSLVNPFMGYWTTMPGESETTYFSGGIFADIVRGLKDMNAMPDRIMFNEEYLKLLLNRMVTSAGIDILFHTYFIGAETENGVVKNITLANKSGLMSFEAEYFIDATGDGDLAALCGCSYKLGRDSDHLCQPMTLCFRAANVDMEKFEEERESIQQLYKKYQAEGKIKNQRENVLTFKLPVDGVLHFNSTRILKKNPVDAFDLTQAEIEGREQVFELFGFLKKNFQAFKDSEIVMTANEIGIRESRKIIGEYILTREDIMSLRKFEDSIALGNYGIDIHSPDGSGTTQFHLKRGEYYTIPYRCLTPIDTKNLLTCGRCISSTHEAQAAYRIMPICCCLGEAAGLATAMAKIDSIDIKSIDVQKLRGKLTEYGAIV